MLDRTMSTSSAIQAEQRCEPDVVHIFPARFAVSSGKLLRTIHGDGYISSPQSLSRSVSTGGDPLHQQNDHEIRLVRPGYIYCFHDVGGGPADNWSVFKSVYHSHLPGQQVYAFRQYKVPRKPWKKWKDKFSGHAHDSYIKVPRDVPNIWIAFSEEQWPYKLFKRAARDVNFRNTFMQKVNLAPKSTQYTCELQELGQYVSEFASDTQFANDMNAFREELFFEKDQRSLRKLCKQDHKKARVVVLRDDIGEANDYAALRTQAIHSHRTVQQELYYPVRIAELINSYQGLADQNVMQTLFDDHHLRKDWKRQAENLALRSEAKPVAIQNAQSCIRDILERERGSGPANVLDQIDALQSLISDIEQEKDEEIWDYQCYLQGSAWKCLDMKDAFKVGREREVNPPSKAVLKLLKTFRKIIKFGWSKRVAMERGKLVNFEYMISMQISWIAENCRKITFDKNVTLGEGFATIFGIDLVEKPLKSNDAREIRYAVMKNFSKAGIIGKSGVPRSDIHIDPSTAEISGRVRSAERGSKAIPGTFIHIEGKIDSRLTPTAQGKFEKLYAHGAQISYVGLALSLFAAINYIADGNSRSNNAHTFAGQLASRAELRVAYETLNVTKYVLELAGHSELFFTDTMAAARSRTVREAGKSGIYRVANLSQSGRSASSIVATLRVFNNLVYGIDTVFALAETAESTYRGNTVGSIGNSMLTSAGLVALASGGTLTPIYLGLVLAGTAITLGADSDIKSWARGSFWGSGRYLYWDELARPSLESQLETAKAMTKSRDKIHNRFMHETLAFYNEACGLVIEQKTFSDVPPGNLFFEIKCPFIWFQEDVRNISLAIFSDAVNTGTTGEGRSGEESLRGAPVLPMDWNNMFTFVESGRVIVKMSPKDFKDDYSKNRPVTSARLVARYPKFLNAGNVQGEVLVEHIEF